MLVLSTLILASAAVITFDPEMAEVARFLTNVPTELGEAQYNTCPGAANAAFNIHTNSQMQVTFTNSCTDVAAEIEARANMEDGWTDPHNGGTYRVISASVPEPPATGLLNYMIVTTRTTKGGKYTDKQTFSLKYSGSGPGGCIANICSASQGTSDNDGGTNICDMFNLFCNSSEKNPENGVSCKPIKTNLQYTIDSEQCGRYVFNKYYQVGQCKNALTVCLKQESGLSAEALSMPKPEAGLQEVMLGEYNFCPRAAYAAFNIHTMSQMEVKFTNTCAEVAGEIEARAGASAANVNWQDPHNGGTYRILNSDATSIETSRTTRGGKYTDKQAFELQDNGTGCTAQICSVSQGTSNNDGGTNLCDMYNLFCNSSEKNSSTGVACKPIKTNLQYTIVQEVRGQYYGYRYQQDQLVNLNQVCLVNTQFTNSLAAPQSS